MLSAEPGCPVLMGVETISDYNPDFTYKKNNRFVERAPSRMQPITAFRSYNNPDYNPRPLAPN